MTIQQRFKQFKAGIITESELLACFRAISIDGIVRDDNSFIGFDYTNQLWIELK